MKNAIQRIFELFAGSETMSGTHGVPTLDDNGVKWVIKSTAKTLKQPVTEDLWKQHLEGTRPLGVIPIRADSKSKWGSIDIDDYEINTGDLIKRVEAAKLPVIPCRSKSGGLHLFLFMAEWTDAKIVQDTLRDIAASLGHAGCEIFPKQTQILADRGEAGNWMIVPYFGGDFSGKIRFQYGLKKTGSEMTLNEFLDVAEAARVTVDDLEKLRINRAKANHAPNGNGKGKTNGVNGHALNGSGKVPFANGPCCLQHMAQGGFPEDGRKRAIFMIGIYLKRAHPSAWKEHLDAHNQKYMKPPLPLDEITSVVKSLDKKDYEYTCKEQPMASHCNSVVCRGRKFGVGVGGEYPVIEAISKLNSDPPLWFVQIPGAHLSLTMEELHNYRKFHMQCMAKAIPPVAFKMIREDVWTSILSDAFQRIEYIEAGPDVGASAIFHELIEDFLTNSTRGQRIEDLLRGAPWENEEEGRHYFRLRDFEAFLSRSNSKIGRNEVITRIRNDYGGDKKQQKVKGSINVNVWFVLSDKISKPVSLDPPMQQESQL